MGLDHLEQGPSVEAVNGIAGRLLFAGERAAAFLGFVQRDLHLLIIQAKEGGHIYG